MVIKNFFIKQKILLFFVLSTFIIGVPLVAFGINTVMDGFRSNKTTQITVDLSSISRPCYKIDNVSGIDYFIPTKSNNEWDYFSAHLPNQVTLTSCTTSCPDGQYLSGETCVTCEAGNWCAGGIKTACVAGTSNPNTGSTSISACAACPCGKYSAAIGATSCNTNCTAGYCCSAGSTSATSNVCAAGRTGLNGNCAYTCAAGFDDYNLTGTCSQTTAGYYSPANDYRRNNCGNGNYCVAGSSSATACPCGTYGATANLTTATCTGQVVCGRYGTTGQTTNQGSGACTAGYFCPTGSCTATANNCGCGNYCAALSCTASQCPADTYSTAINAINSTTCTACGVGQK